MRSTDLFVWGFLLHHIADWFLQTKYMALSKYDPRHKSGLIHGAIHAVIQLIIFPFWLALSIGLSHWIIDSTVVLAWFRERFGMTTDGPFARDTQAIWQDQVAHWIVIGAAALIAGK